MGFVFSVLRAGRIPSAGIIYLDGMIESGVIKGGEIATIKGMPKHQVTIKSIALVNSRDTSSQLLTLSIEDPELPLAALEGMVLENAT